MGLLLALRRHGTLCRVRPFSCRPSAAAKPVWCSCFAESGYPTRFRLDAVEGFANASYINLHTDRQICLKRRRSGVCAQRRPNLRDIWPVSFYPIHTSRQRDDCFGYDGAGATLSEIIHLRRLSPLAAAHRSPQRGPLIARDALTLELGLDMNLSEQSTLGIGSGQVGEGVQDHGASARLKQSKGWQSPHWVHVVPSALGWIKASLRCTRWRGRQGRSH